MKKTKKVLTSTSDHDMIHHHQKDEFVDEATVIILIIVGSIFLIGTVGLYLLSLFTNIN